MALRGCMQVVDRVMSWHTFLSTQLAPCSNLPFLGEAIEISVCFFVVNSYIYRINGWEEGKCQNKCGLRRDVVP
jgi:hypothetical protein